MKLNQCDTFLGMEQQKNPGYMQFAESLGQNETQKLSAAFNYAQKEQTECKIFVSGLKTELMILRSRAEEEGRVCKEVEVEVRSKHRCL